MKDNNKDIVGPNRTEELSCSALKASSLMQGKAIFALSKQEKCKESQRVNKQQPKCFVPWLRQPEGWYAGQLLKRKGDSESLRVFTTLKCRRLTGQHYITHMHHTCALTCTRTRTRTYTCVHMHKHTLTRTHTCTGTCVVLLTYTSISRQYERCAAELKASIVLLPDHDMNLVVIIQHLVDEPEVEIVPVTREQWNMNSDALTELQIIALLHTKGTRIRLYIGRNTSTTVY